MQLFVPDPIRDIAARLTGAGYECVLVGGGVRDQLAGRAPKDFDLATNAVPAEVARLLPGATVTTRFGTTLVPVGGELVEVTTYRTEAGYADYRRPDRIDFTGDLATDLARRDFTINAIAYDIASDELIDPFGGLVDLQAGLLRAVGEPGERFSEDALRLLRAVRFVATFGFVIEPATRTAIARQASLTRHLASERIGMELDKMVAGQFAADGLREAHALGLMPALLPDIAGREFDHAWATFATFVAAYPDAHSAARYAALLHHAADGTYDGARQRTVHLGRLALGEDVAAEAAAEMMIASLPYRAGTADADLLPSVARAGYTAAAWGAAIRIACGNAGGWRDGDALLSTITRLESAGVPLRVTDLAIGGDELIAHFRRSPGRWIGEMLNALLLAVWAGSVRNEAGALLAAAASLG